MLYLQFCQVFLFFSLAGGESARKNHSKIQPELFNLLEEVQTTDVIVAFGGIKAALEKAALLNNNGNRGTRNEGILRLLEEHADFCQRGVIQLLTQPVGGDTPDFLYIKQYKSSNLLFVKNASIELIRVLAQDDNVTQIAKEPVYRVITSMGRHPSVDDVEKQSKSIDGWGSRKMHVLGAWKELGNGKRGEGVIVASIGTGVQFTHEALSENFMGKYGWHDAVNYTSEPYEDDSTESHGTHTMGILAGSKGIGIAPGALWTSCKACEGLSCKAEHVLDCIHWAECPYLDDGSNRDCSKAPHVVLNSWETLRGETGYNEFILRWQAMNIIPVFPIGDYGPHCFSSTTPANLRKVIGVGACNNRGMRLEMSGVGPGENGVIKPDILAPGFNVVSAVGNNSDYGHRTGTMQSAAHVAGVVALLKARNLSLVFEDAYRYLVFTSDLRQIGQQFQCNLSSSVFPNYYYGYGIVNATRALRTQTLYLGNTHKQQEQFPFVSLIMFLFNMIMG